ncbi:hypothetical protein Nstercoris_00695 [Nitrosomonas stercoris]|uniref:Uncharacterized protein n=1 Tax=Nitrosomonas stercoris TaxID=1444684 RepID=A0A4Y1YL66_9PROT|nr:hypothetical protein Nstercoris_00695 [Nitrosomonas stercoris]
MSLSDPDRKWPGHRSVPSRQIEIAYLEAIKLLPEPEVPSEEARALATDTDRNRHDLA